MQAKIKKFTSLFLVLMLVIGAVTAVPITASATETDGEGGDSGFQYEMDYYNEGSIIITGYNGSDTDLVIPGSIDGYTVTGIGYHAFENCTGLQSVTIPEGVTSIKSGAFLGCTGLANITIPYSVYYIGGYAFGYCYDENTWDYINLDDFTITGYPRTAAQTYADENGFEFIALDPSGLPKFRYYISEENYSIYISGYNGSDTELVIPSEIDGIKVTGIDREAFKDCTSLKSVTIPDTVTDIWEYAFIGCTGLTEINVSENNPVYSSVDGALLNKEKTTLIMCPQGKNEYTIHDSVTGISWYAFSGCNLLTDINVSENNPVYSSIDGALLSKDKTTLMLCPPGKKEYIIPNSVTHIDSRAFYICTELRSVTISNSVTRIDYGSFFNCTALTSIFIPDSVISIGWGVFENTAWLDNQPDGLVYAGKVAYRYKGEMPENTEIVLKDGTLGIADRAFLFCSNLTDITIPDSVISVGTSAFDYTAWYEKQPDGVVYAGKLAYGYKGEIPENTEIVLKDGTTGFADGAFDYTYSEGATSGLTSVTMPDSVTSIAYKAFSGCSDLADVTIPQSVKSIGDYAFYDCNELTSVTIPENVTDIGDYALGYEIDRETWNTVKLENFTISGYTGTAAEQYAKDNGFEFIALEPAVVSGDASGDGVVDAKDRMLLSRYLAKWKGYENIDVKAADVNNDGEINAKDRMILARHLAKWKGYETLPFDK